MLFDFIVANQIRKLYVSGCDRKQLSQMFKCCYSTIDSIIHNRSYHNKNYIPPQKIPIDKEYCAELQAKNKTLSEIAREEAKHAGRSKPLAIESVRRAILSLEKVGNGKN